MSRKNDTPAGATGTQIARKKTMVSVLIIDCYRRVNFDGFNFDGFSFDGFNRHLGDAAAVNHN
jgi:hypothetical protein